MPARARSASSIPDFQDWPLNERVVVETLARWAHSRRKLVVFGHNFDSLSRNAPRFAEWRRQWSHIVQCRSDPDLEEQQVPTFLLVQGEVVVRLLDPVAIEAWSRGGPPTRWRPRSD